MDSRCICETLKPGQGRMLWTGESWNTWLVRRKNGKHYALEFRSSAMRSGWRMQLELDHGKGYRLYKLLRRYGGIPVDEATMTIWYCPRCGRPLHEEMAEVLLQEPYSEQAEVLEDREKKTKTRKNGGERSNPCVRAMLLVVMIFNALLLVLTLLKF